MPWAAAFALGAVVSPTDPLAATEILRRLGVPRRTVNMIEGESLVNDATALVAYKLAVGAAIGGDASRCWDAGIASSGRRRAASRSGSSSAFVIAEIRKRLDDPPVEITVSLLSGYAAYIPAERARRLGRARRGDGGTALGWWAPEIARRAGANAGLRRCGRSSIFLLNALLFVLIGLQLPTILDGLSGYSTGTLVGYAAAVSGGRDPRPASCGRSRRPYADPGARPPAEPARAARRLAPAPGRRAGPACAARSRSPPRSRFR